MLVQPEFPGHRRADPKRRAELTVYDGLSQSETPGRALYEVRPLATAPQLDFAVWLEAIAVYGVQVKGGHYELADGQWHLVTATGRSPKNSPLTQTWDAALAIHDVIKDRLHRQTVVIPALLMPDMEPDPVIEEAAEAARVHVLWQTDRLVHRLAGLVVHHRIYSPPTARSIQEEAELIMPGLGGPPASPTPPEQPDPAAAPTPVVIHNVEKLEVHINAGGLNDMVTVLERLLDGLTPDSADQD